MWELDYKETWTPKNWFWTVVLEKTLESPLNSKEIQPVNPKGNQSWIFTGRTDAEAEAPILWPPDAKNWLTGKDPDDGKIEVGKKKKIEVGEGDDRGWDGWMASLTQWTWVWVSSRTWWWTGRPGMLQFMGLQRVRHDWVTGLNWTEILCCRSTNIDTINYFLNSLNHIISLYCQIKATCFIKNKSINKESWLSVLVVWT